MILLQFQEHRARLTLNLADSHNALDAAALEAFHARLDEVEQLPAVRVLEISGAGNQTFCAGASLKQLRSGEIDPARFTRLTDRLDALPIPSVCVLNGSVYGGGAEIALCCDFRIGVTGARLRVPPARIGLCYPRNGMRRFLSRLGLQTTRRLLLLAEELDSLSMLDVGFLDQLVDRDELEDAVSVLSNRLCALAPLALAAMKSSLNQLAAGLVSENQLDILERACSESMDLKEGLAAQRERREPNFSGC